MSEDDAKLDKVLGTGTVEFPSGEHSIFSALGIGKKENRTSSLLAYFLQVPAPHALGSAFCEAFFRCIQKSDAAHPELYQGLSFDDVKAVTEVHTREGNRIDLLVSGADQWLLIIENKIEAGSYNDFDAYRAHGERFNQPKKFFAVLLPMQRPEIDWIQVTYRDYCEELDAVLAQCRTDARNAEWLVIAKNLVRALRRTGVTLRSEQIAYIAGHFPRDTAEAIWDLYLKGLESQLREALPKHHVWVDEWTIWCVRSEARRWQITFQTPLHPGGNPSLKWRIDVDVFDLNEEQKKKAHDKLDKGYCYRPNGSAESWEGCYNKRSEAIEAVSTLARELAAITGE